LYLSPSPAHETIGRSAESAWKPQVTISGSTQYLGVKPYGMERLDQLFTDRQLATLTTFSDLVTEARERIQRDALFAGLPGGDGVLAAGGTGATAYADAVSTYLAFGLSKTTDYNCSLVPWFTKEDRPGHLFSRQAIPMVWDYAEVNPLARMGGTFSASVEIVAGALAGCAPDGPAGRAIQADAVSVDLADGAVVSTDPPYYDNVPYADLSDFFYVWMRRSLKAVFPDLFATVAAPKAEELVAFAYRHESKAAADEFFLRGMTQAMHRLKEHAHPGFPVTIYYAFKQTESDGDEGVASTGWETFLDAVIRAGFAISGTWPMRTERGTRSRGIGSNALASSIVLVCRPCRAGALDTTRREFVAALKAELPKALAYLQAGNIAPVDLAQAAIGPGMAVYTRYAKVLDAGGKV
jgi:putative DNA methylase